MGVGMLTELMMRFWPKSCCSYNKLLIHDALVTLGMAEGDFVWPKTPSIYQDFMGKCATILRKMEQMKLPRRPEPGNDEPPDYITVNEFLWFVHDYKHLIKEEVMKKQWKPVNSKEKIKNGTRKLSDAFANDAMLKRLAAALRTKPFAILAGHSGTGKSQLVRRLAYMTCNNELLVKEGAGKTAPGNYCMVQVKPNWHDSTDLIGYYSEMGGRHFVNTPFVEFICKAYAYPDTPFFVCLDEMNLAPVEQYFAEYLSAIESMEKKGGEWVTDPLVEVDKTGEKDADGKDKVNPEIVDQIMQGAASTEAAAWIQSHGLTIPKNLFVVGTVNMDETTCQFSRKVLDRAMTLLMNDVKFVDMATSKKPSEEELLDNDGLKFFLEGEERGQVGEAESKFLDGINEPLGNTAFVVAYRFANEYALYEAAWAKLNGVDLNTASDEDKNKFAVTALDHVVLMKLLPRIHGEVKTVKGIFDGRKVDGKDVPGLKSKLPADGLSVAMMGKILARDDEYLTFWP
jgi:energy-coupling factor transporter ATP-binding protein EcfA2